MQETEGSSYLLDRDGGLPRLLLIQDREANSPRWVYIRMEERRGEFACQEHEGESNGQEEGSEVRL